MRSVACRSGPRRLVSNQPGSPSQLSTEFGTSSLFLSSDESEHKKVGRDADGDQDDKRPRRSPTDCKRFLVLGVSLLAGGPVQLQHGLADPLVFGRVLALSIANLSQ